MNRRRELVRMRLEFNAAIDRIDTEEHPTVDTFEQRSELSTALLDVLHAIAKLDAQRRDAERN